MLTNLSLYLVSVTLIYVMAREFFIIAYSTPIVGDAEQNDSTTTTSDSSARSTSKCTPFLCKFQPMVQFDKGL